MRLNYHLLDVFTDRQFGGNQLAVFTDPPSDLPAATMQQIAKELNLSEITFVLQPADPANDYRLRIFTPAAEMPMAGHPTVGSAYALARLGELKGKTSIKFEEGVGPITVDIHVDEQGQPTDIWMQQPLPQFLEIYGDRRAIAEMLSLNVNDLRPDIPLQILSSAVPFLYVTLTSLAAMAKIDFRIDLWRNTLAGSRGENVFVTTTETVLESSTVHSRMFAPALGIAEDPATGAASGPLGAYLHRYRLTESCQMVSEQGFAMGRPSLIHIDLEHRGDSITKVAIGGQCAYMGYGTLLLD